MSNDKDHMNKAPAPVERQVKQQTHEFSLTREMNTLFEKCFHSAHHYIEDLGTAHLPLVNIIDGGAAFYVEAAVPGLAPENVSTEIAGGLLTIRGGKDAELDDEISYLRRELHSAASFTRTITLPSIVDAEQSSATFSNGMLVVTLPKKEGGDTAPHKIDIQGSA